jgi:hypothetical protein
MSIRVEDLVNLAIKIKDEFEVLFIVQDDTFCPLLIKNNIKYICLHCKEDEYYVSKSISQRLIRNKSIGKFLNKIKPLSIGQLIWQQLFYYDYKFYYRVCKKIIEKRKIDLFVTINDRFYYPIEMALLKICKEKHIPIVIPYIMNYNPDVSYSMINGNSKYMLTKKSSTFQKVVFSKYKKQSFRDLYFLPAFLFVALERFGTLSTMPWVNGGGLSDVVVMANKIGKDLHLDMNIDKEKLKILGDISLEQVYKTFINKNDVKNLVLDKYGLNHDKKLMIIGLVNWWEHGLASKEEHFNIMFYTIESCLKHQNKYNILLILHPSMEIENYKFLEDKYALRIASESTMNILPICDLYVINYSSTIIWALLCDIKTIIVGYHKKMDTYKKFKSIVTVREKNELESKLLSLINRDINFTEDQVLLSKKEVFDDKVIDRYKKLFNNLLNK